MLYNSQSQSYISTNDGTHYDGTRYDGTRYDGTSYAADSRITLRHILLRHIMPVFNLLTMVLESLKV